MIENTSIPWVEKYRPNEFHNIVLDTNNQIILENIIETEYFPHLLFYGPPGTGKTTAVINLVKSYQIKMGEYHKGLMIHLNASDERGIDIIRNQIQPFVNSKSLFNKGMKFVILDEVDYMTKNAQQALRCLLMNYSDSVRFCLMCNYISKIDEGLQNEFLKIRFNNLPEDKIISFLKNICVNENIQITDKTLHMIQQMYNSDIRSMINFIQSRYESEFQEISIIHEEVWENMYNIFQNTSDTKDTLLHIENIKLLYNIDKLNIINDFLNYILRHHTEMISSDFLLFVENVVHSQKNSKYLITYAISQLHLSIPKL